ncbi:MAG: MgtC/SapB family protein [Acidobacteria bacterium]|nr:MgtC/SapB family protein [Acidobacteriota bacterium]
MLDPGTLILRLFVAAVLGAAIGLERELRRRAAGLRTNTLIAVGAALFTMMSLLLGADHARIAAQIVTGIGFLGGGAILRAQGQVSGITTAATIWVNAAIGMAAGAGYYIVAVTATATTLLVLVAFAPLDRWIERLEQRRTNQRARADSVNGPLSPSE